jgi:hypothetical protein
MYMDNVEGIIREVESVNITQPKFDVRHALRGGQVSGLVQRIRDIFDPYDMSLVRTASEIDTN